MECTYGDRLHGVIPDHVSVLAGIVQKTLDRKGNVVIPAFAVGRTQELLYMFRRIKAEKLVTGHDGFEVYVDSLLQWKRPRSLKIIWLTATTRKQRNW